MTQALEAPTARGVVAALLGDALEMLAGLIPVVPALA
jgi:hypothetical protein